jgi:hypothetical protein
VARSGASPVEQRVVSRFSERPYRLRIRQPGNILVAASTTDPGMGAPAHTQMRRELASSVAGLNAFISICRKGVAVTAAVSWCSRTRRTPSAGSHFSMKYEEAPRYRGISTLVTKPVLWVIGDGPNCTSSAE